MFENDGDRNLSDHRLILAGSVRRLHKRFEMGCVSIAKYA